MTHNLTEFPVTKDKKKTNKILVVDDDSGIRNLIYRFLGNLDYEMESARDGETALKIFAEFQPDLVILDVVLPDIIGYKICKQIKQKSSRTRVMLLTSLKDVEDQVTGLECADAFVTKPFHLRVLEKQVQALLRLLPAPSNHDREQLVFGSLKINPVSREVTKEQETISLTVLEFDLLYCLAKQPNKAWSRKELIKEVWGHNYVADERLVDVHIGQIRRKIEVIPNQPEFVHTVRGYGYKFEFYPKDRAAC
ncbi:response regulator transcription factor [Oscillatoria salina]|uniref:response regulator transcription factor n=1 Tax=Oscillatoria salina TaxID=331517 RepID=UPI0013B687F6|nr:response regulator transcription factor [Oscillatoria salina]MBZ8179415.1 response regulator transcription factor [Oscillatoria salina IIICB1]NET87846.1 response regulator transcription factor [Kamptonema sp. SIO1D9]